jgi:outer membrane protein OmpA-like peptidoglycan-associated protein
VIHLAYLAERQAEIGEARLAELRARQEIAQGEAARNAVLLEARERDARLASSQADANAQDAEMARQAARSAEQRAQTAQEDLKASQQQFAELQAKQTERGMVLTLGDALFDTAQSNLKPGATQTLDRLARFMRENEGTRVLIEGYTDARGTAEYNQELSRRRASAVAEALESRGTDRSRVNVAGRGEDLPVANNDSAPEDRDHANCGIWLDQDYLFGSHAQSLTRSRNTVRWTGMTFGRRTRTISLRLITREPCWISRRGRDCSRRETAARTSLRSEPVLDAYLRVRSPAGEHRGQLAMSSVAYSQ